MLMPTNHIKLMDNKLKSIAKLRYADDITKAHQTLYKFYVDQPNSISDNNGKFQWYNYNKFIELPFHAYKVATSADQSVAATLNIDSFETSPYLTNLSWIYTKIKATKGVHYILNDLYLLEAGQRSKSKHLVLLQSFLEKHIRPINYDADQFYPLLKSFVQKATVDDPELENDAVCRQWMEDFEAIPISYLEHVANNEVEDDDSNAKTPYGYDAIVNLGGNGFFVASISTAREEICVWDVSR